MHLKTSFWFFIKQLIFYFQKLHEAEEKLQRLDIKVQEQKVKILLYKKLLNDLKQI